MIAAILATPAAAQNAPGGSEANHPHDPAAASDRHRTGAYVIAQPGVPTEHYRDATQAYRRPIVAGYKDPIRQKQPFLPDLRRPGQDTTWQVNVPETYRPGDAHGILVFINAGDTGQSHPFVRDELSERKLIAIGADQTGNDQDMVFRHAAAVHAVELIKRRYDIDEERIYVYGVSGGGRMTSHVIFIHGHLFDGAIALIGCNAYLNTPGPRPRTIRRGFWPNPDRDQLTHVKRHNRIVLLTGEDDFNKPGTQRVYNTYRKQGFSHLSYLEEPGLGHAFPSRQYMQQALDLLDAPLFEGLEAAYRNAQAAEDKGRLDEARRLYARCANYGAAAPWIDQARAKAQELQGRYDQDLAAIDALFADPAVPAGDISKAVRSFRKTWQRQGPVADALRKQLRERRAAEGG